jgi:hypothetical protein
MLKKGLNIMYIKEALEKHKKWLKNCPNGERANFNGLNLMGVDLSRADLSKAIICMVDLSASILKQTIFTEAFLKETDFSGADLKGANLRGADLRGANFRRADLRGAYFEGADLRGADLREANVEGASFEGASLERANLSRTKNMSSTIGFIKDNFEFTNEGIIAYKTFGDHFVPPKDWKIERGSVISENVNFCRTDSCGCGINVAPLEWVYKNYKGEIWKVLIRWEWLVGVCVPYDSDGKIRCERVELVEIVDNKPSSSAFEEIIY